MAEVKYIDAKMWQYSNNKIQTATEKTKNSHGTNSKHF